MSIFDHAKAVKDLMKAGIDCYMSEGTAKALGTSGHRLYKFSGIKKGDILTYKPFKLASYTIIPLALIHDVLEPTGYLIEDSMTGESVLFVTDTAYMIYKIPAVDYIMIECNYVKSVLDEKVEQGKINVSLRNRIVKNHMSLETLVEALKAADLSRCKKIYVLHLSDGNSNEEMIKRQIQEVSGCEVVIC